MRRLHGISNFFVELLNLLSDYLQRPKAQEAQQICVMRGKLPGVSLSFRNSDTYLEVFLESLPGAGFYVMLQLLLYLKSNTNNVRKRILQPMHEVPPVEVTSQISFYCDIHV